MQNKILQLNSVMIRNNKIIFYFYAFLLLFYYLLMLFFQIVDRNTNEFFLWLFILQFVFILSYFFIRNNTEDLAYKIIFFGIIFGVFMSFTQTSLSDDIFRYLFNGHLMRNGLNPYLYSPDSLNMLPIINSFPYYDLINNPSIPEPYPPIMLYLTYVITLITGNDVILWKLMTSFCVLLCSIYLVKILRNMKRNPNEVLLWAWNPIVILEFSHSGHNDIFPIIFLILAIFFLLNNKENKNLVLFLSGFLWAISISLKFFPLIFLLFFVKKLKIVGILGLIFGFLINLPIIFLVGAYSSAGINIFLTYWRFNGGIYEFSSRGLKYLMDSLFQTQISVQEIYTFLREIFQILIGVFIIALVIFFYFKSTNSVIGYVDDNLSYGNYAIFVFFMLTPVIHPWYLLWALPGFILMSSKPFKVSYFALTITIMISYYFYTCNCENITILLFEYIPIYIFIVLEIINNKNNIVKKFKLIKS